MSGVGVDFLVQSAIIRTSVRDCLTLLNALLVVSRGEFLSESHARIAALSKAKLHLQATYNAVGQFAFIEAASNDSAVHTSWVNILTKEGLLIQDESPCSNESAMVTGFVSILSTSAFILIPLFFVFIIYSFIVHGMIWEIHEQQKTVCALAESAMGKRQQEDQQALDLHGRISELRNYFDRTYHRLLTEHKVNDTPELFSHSDLVKMVTKLFRQLSQTQRENKCLSFLYRQMQAYCSLRCTEPISKDTLSQAETKNNDFFPETKDLGKLEFLGRDVNDYFPMLPESLRQEMTSLDSVDPDAPYSDFIKKVNQKLSDFRAFWFPPPLTPVNRRGPLYSRHLKLNVDSNNFPQTRAVGSFVIAARMAELTSIETRGDRQPITLWGKVAALTMNDQGVLISRIILEDSHWQPLDITNESRRIFAKLLPMFSTDQDVECRHSHIADTVCRSCNRRILCPHTCHICSLSMEMALENLKTEGVLRESTSKAHELIYFQSVYLSTMPCKEYVNYPYSRSPQCEVDLTDAMTRWIQETPSSNAVMVYNHNRYCLECGRYHSIPEAKLLPIVYQVDELEYDSFQHQVGKSFDSEDDKPFRRCPFRVTGSSEAEDEYERIDAESMRSSKSMSSSGRRELNKGSFGKSSKSLIKSTSVRVHITARQDDDTEEHELEELLPVVEESVPSVSPNLSEEVSGSLIHRALPIETASSFISRDNESLVSANEIEEYQTKMEHIIRCSLVMNDSE